ncbi:MAG: hypothetical protein IH810_04160 [Proteobacteria bacterium]|nr:hypothetical protein [Pseudomonadota bacterium]
MTTQKTRLHRLAERVTLLSSAEVGGDLHARLPRGEEAQISPSASIGGEALSEHIVHDHGMRFMTGGFWIAIVLHIAAAFALGQRRSWYTGVARDALCEIVCSIRASTTSRGTEAVSILARSSWSQD